MSENNGMNNPQWEDPTPKVKAKGRGPIIGLATLGLAAVVGVGIYASGILGNFGGASKQDRVSDALVSLMEGEENKFISDWMGGDELTKNMMKGYNFSGNLELVDLPVLNETAGFTLPKGIMLSFEGATDAAAKAGSGKLSLGLMGTDFVSAQFFGSDSKFQMAAPALFKEVITADLTGDLAAKIKNAPLFQSMANTAEAEKSITMFVDALKANQGQSEKLMKFITGELKLEDYQGIKDNTKAFKDKWVIEAAQDKTLQFNGKQEAFKGFNVTMKKADYIAYLKAMKTYVLTDAKFKADFTDLIVQQLAATESITKEAAYTKLDQDLTEAIAKLEADPLAKDLTITIHMTKENKLVSLTSVYDGKDNAKINLLIERMGGDFFNQNAKLNLSVTGGSEPGSLEVVSSGKTEGSVQTRQIKINSAGQAADDKVQITMDMSLNKETGAFSVTSNMPLTMEGTNSTFDLSLKGKIEDVVKDKSAAMVFDEIILSVDQKPQASFKAEMKYNTENVAVKELEGAPMDIFTADEEDMNNIMNQIMENFGGLLNLFGAPLGF